MYVLSINLDKMHSRNVYEGNPYNIENMRRSGKERDGSMSEMLEKILSDENIRLTKKRVYANKGAGGVDGVTVRELDEYLSMNWTSIKQQIRERKYRPQPVLRVEIPKPGGGVRKLGIPTVIDRTIEQAIVPLRSISAAFIPTRCGPATSSIRLSPTKRHSSAFQPVLSSIVA